MMANGNRQPADLLCRAALLAGILAVIAGIFGMHVMTGNHTAHTLGAAPPSSVSLPALAPMSGQNHHGHSTAGQQVPAAGAEPAEACTGSFATAEVPGASCTPSTKTGSLTVAPPGDAGPAAHETHAPQLVSIRGFAYRPTGPSPGDLSISRT